MLEDPDCKPATVKPAKKYNTVLVFGEGPLKPVLIDEELSLLQKTLWTLDHHKSATELDFHVMQNPQHLSQLEKIMTDKLLSQSEKMTLVKELRKKWQWIGWYTVKKWGRHNAMAAGNLLLHGKTEKIILSGGRTFPKWHKLATDQYNQWPSEAEMMADIIIQYYGSLYQKKIRKKYRRSIIYRKQIHQYAGEFCIYSQSTSSPTPEKNKSRTSVCGTSFTKNIYSRG